MTNADKSLAALWTDSGSFDLIDQSVPEPGPGDVVLQVGSAGICGSDLFFLGVRNELDPVPVGHEVAGTVISAGQAVRGMVKGDRVAVEMVGLSRACMSCWFCRQGQYVKCENRQERRGGGFASYMCVPAHACFKLPPSMTWEQGALVEPLAVSVHAVRLAEVHSYETAVVLGAGTIGLTCVAALSAMGVRDILVTARHPHQAEMAKRLGASEVVEAEDEDGWLRAADAATGRGADIAVPEGGSALLDKVHGRTEGRGADVVFECVGGTSGGSLAQAIYTTRKTGRIVSVGGPKNPIPFSTVGMLQRELRLIMSHCYAVLDGKHDYEVAIKILESGVPPLGDLVTHRYGLSEINEAFALAKDKSSGSLKVQLIGA